MLRPLICKDVSTSAPRGGGIKGDMAPQTSIHQKIRKKRKLLWSAGRDMKDRGRGEDLRKRI